MTDRSYDEFLLGLLARVAVGVPPNAPIPGVPGMPPGPVVGPTLPGARIVGPPLPVGARAPAPRPPVSANPVPRPTQPTEKGLTSPRRQTGPFSAGGGGGAPAQRAQRDEDEPWVLVQTPDGKHSRCPVVLPLAGRRSGRSHRRR